MQSTEEEEEEGRRWKKRCEFRLAVFLFDFWHIFWANSRTLRHVNTLLFWCCCFGCVDAHSSTSFRHVMRTRYFFTQHIGPRVTFDRLNDARWWMRRAYTKLGLGSRGRHTDNIIAYSFDSWNVALKRSRTHQRQGTFCRRAFPNRPTYSTAQSFVCDYILSWHDLEMFSANPCHIRISFAPSFFSIFSFDYIHLAHGKQAAGRRNANESYIYMNNYTMYYN